MKKKTLIKSIWIRNDECISVYFRRGLMLVLIKISLWLRKHFDNSIAGIFESRVRISKDTFILKRHRNYTYHEKFPFLLERKRNHIEYFHCIQKYATHCKARLTIKRFKNGNDQYTQVKEHNHDLKSGIFRDFSFKSIDTAFDWVFFLLIFSYRFR